MQLASRRREERREEKGTPVGARSLIPMVYSAFSSFAISVASLYTSFLFTPSFAATCRTGRVGESACRYSTNLPDVYNGAARVDVPHYSTNQTVLLRA
eukprot:9487849-Pyramimonas_sp.AAC.1